MRDRHVRLALPSGIDEHYAPYLNPPNHGRIGFDELCLMDQKQFRE